MPRSASNRTVAAIVVGILSVALSACGGAQARMAKHLEKGRGFLMVGNYEKARIEFQNALQIAPTDPEARFENGVVDEKLGKNREAGQFYQSAIDVSPDHLGARAHLARLLLLAGAPDKTLDTIRTVLAQHPDDAELLALRAAARVQTKDIAGAQADAERAVQLDSTNEDAVSALAGIYVNNKSADRALALLEGSIKKIPGPTPLRLALAQVYLAENRPADIERVMLDMVRLQPEDMANRVRLAQFYVRQNEIDAAERVLREGIKAIPQNRDLELSLVDFLSVHRSPEVANKELLGMIAADPKNVELKFALAQFYVANHQPELAEKIFREVIDAEKLDAAGIIARDRLAALRAQANDLKGTEDLVAQVLAKSPRDTEALKLRADIELTKKDPKSAIVDLRTVLRDQPGAVGVSRTLARAHVLNGEPAIAGEVLRRALETNPKDPFLRLDLALLLGQMGKPEQAKPMLADLVKEHPDDMQALESLFRVSANLKDLDTAKSAADGMVAAEPKSAIGYIHQGQLAEEAKRNEDALHLYSRAAELQPDALEPLQAECRLLMGLKRTPEALKLLDEITAKYPDNGFAPNIKGELLALQKNREGAETAFKTAIARAPVWWVPYRNLAAMQFADNDANAAIATLRSAQTTVSQPDQASFEIASYLERSGKPEDAIREYDSIVRQNPQSDAAANNLAMLLVTYGKDSSSLDRAKSLTVRFAESSNPNFLDTYGWVLFKHGEAAASLPVLQRVASKVPGAPVVLYHLGMAQSQSGSNEQALDNLTRAVNSGAKFNGLDEAKATLDRLARLKADSTPKT